MSKERRKLAEIKFSFPAAECKDTFPLGVTERPNNLYRTKTYLVGHMQYANGEDWRLKVEKSVAPLGVQVFTLTKNHSSRM